MSLLGRRFKTLVSDVEEDDTYGLVEHPAGTTFVVVEVLHQEQGVQMYAVSWETAISIKTGKKVRADGLWTIWSEKEILTEAVEVLPEVDGGTKE